MTTDETPEVTRDETTEVTPSDQTVRIDMSWVSQALERPSPEIQAERERLLGALLEELKTVDLAGREAEWREVTARIARSIFGVADGQG